MKCSPLRHLAPRKANRSLPFRTAPTVYVPTTNSYYAAPELVPFRTFFTRAIGAVEARLAVFSDAQNRRHSVSHNLRNRSGLSSQAAVPTCSDRTTVTVLRCASTAPILRVVADKEKRRPVQNLETVSGQISSRGHLTGSREGRTDD